MAVLAGLTVPLVLRLGEFLWRFEWYRSSGQWGEKTSWPASVHLATLTVQTLTAVLMGWSIFVKSERHYALPVATRDLFLSRLVNGTAFVVAGMGIGTLLARLILWTDWPVATPALYAGVGWVAALWIGTRFRGQDWRIALAGSLVACLLFCGLLWHLYRFDGWEYVEQPFAPSGVEEIGLLVAAVLWLGGAALRAGELDRCGLAGERAYVPLPESMRSKPVLELPATKEAARPLRPYRFSWIALLAEDWRRNGWLYPVAAAIVTAFFGVIVVGASLDEYRRSGYVGELPDIPSGAAGFGVGFLFLGAFLQVAASAHGRQMLRHGTQPIWALTLPVADRHVAAVAVLRQLLSNASAMLACWVVAIALWGVLYLLLLVLGQSSRVSELVEHLRRMGRGDPSHGLFVALIAAWVATGVSEASLQCGRRWCVAIPHLILIGTWFVAVAFAIAFREGEFFIGLCSWVGMLASIFSTLVAVRAKVIPWTWGVAALVLWGLTWTAYKYLSAFQLSPSPAWFEWQGFFALSLVMLPISLPPLAVAWNRRR